MREQVNGFKLDKSHTFAVNMFDEIERYMRVPDEYEQPEEKTFQPSVGSLFWPSWPLGGGTPCTCTITDGWRAGLERQTTAVWHAPACLFASRAAIER